MPQQDRRVAQACWGRNIPPPAPSAAVRAPRVATRLWRRRVWLRIFVVRRDLPCDPPVGGHSCNAERIAHLSYGGRLLRCGISVRLMTASGQKRWSEQHSRRVCFALLSGNPKLRPSLPKCANSGHCRHSPNGIYGISAPDHSALMPVNFTTLPHFSVSSAISLPKSAGEPASTVPPRSASRTFMLGSSRPALVSALSLSTICDGVFLGEPMPDHPLAS